MKYRKKPVVIEATLIKNDNLEELIDLMQGNEALVLRTKTDGQTVEYVEIETLEGVMRGNVGDYIIKGVQGELYPCKPDIFQATYELAE